MEEPNTNNQHLGETEHFLELVLRQVHLLEPGLKLPNLGEGKKVFVYFFYI
jgi:hypothetical protein